jgi:simple sugar transport system ATP-binding protein
VHDLLRHFVADGVTQCFTVSTGSLTELIELSHRIGVISRGRLVGMVDNDGNTVAERVGRT